jgi:hypothetical protein
MKGIQEMMTWEQLTLFPSIPLEDVRRHDLSHRYDAKFLVCRESMTAFFKSLKDHLVVQRSGDGRPFSHYLTDYWDTVGLSYFADHAKGRPRRLKVRKRLYADTGDCFLEIKSKCRGKTLKERVVSVMDGHVDSPKDADFLKSHGIDPDGLERTLTVEYDRVTLWAPDWSGRISVDTSLKVSDEKGSDHFGNVAILEIKGDRRFHTRILRLFPLPLQRYETGFSKYAIGLLHRRELRSSGGKGLLEVYKYLLRTNNLGT